MSIIESKIDENNDITLHPTLPVFFRATVLYRLGLRKMHIWLLQKKYSSSLLQCGITHWTCIFLLDPRPTATNKIIFIDTVATYCGSLRMGLTNFSTLIPTSTKLFLYSMQCNHVLETWAFKLKFRKIQNLSKDN